MDVTTSFSSKPDEPLGALWLYLKSWVSADGGINGPVVHRGDLKRMFAIHDTAWTQQAVIQGLLHLFRRTGHSYWLDQAIFLADAQAARITADGHFRWAGHEDDRFSSLVHNSMADVALLDMAEVLQEVGDQRRAETYILTAQQNLQDYLIGRLYRPKLNGFAMNSTDYYLGRDRFVVNMNSVAIEALGKLDQQQNTSDHSNLIRTVGGQILALQTRTGKCSGSFPYAHWQPDMHVPLYTAITLRGYRQLYRVTGDAACLDSARQVLHFLERVRCPETGFWPHKLVGDRIFPYPFFVSGAGIIANGIIDASEMMGAPVDSAPLSEPLLRHQYTNGAIRNFIGYNHSNNGRFWGSGAPVWEDIYPTPSWNAQAFHFLSQVLPAPDTPIVPTYQRARATTGAFLYRDTARFSMVLGYWPPAYSVIACYVKRWRYGFVIPGPWMWAMSMKKLLMNFSLFRTMMAWLRHRIDKRA